VSDPKKEGERTKTFPPYKVKKVVGLEFLDYHLPINLGTYTLLSYC